MDTKTILVFSILFIALLFASAQIQSSFTNEVNENQGEIQQNRELQLEAREIQNDYRNTTLAYLANITERINNLEEKISLPLEPQ